MTHIFAVSDATGITAERVVRAALVQFDDHNIEISRYGDVRSASQIKDIVLEASSRDGIVVHTFVFAKLRHAMLAEGRRHNVTTIDLMGPLLVRLSEQLEMQPRSEPGLFQSFDAGYLQRIEAINFTVRHDDGKNVDDLDRAEIVLVGVSRTSKTPLSVFLATRGWRVANVPILLNMEPPGKLFELPRHRVVGLTVKPERLVELRRTRTSRMGTPARGYADLEHVRAEVAYAYEIFDRRRDWPLVDVTYKSLEEASAEVVALIGINAHNITGGLDISSV
jgi:regulator of PEP synthase PpsR (kinase-PPPase family)